MENKDYYEQLKEMYENGVKVRCIQKKLGISNNKIYKALAEMKVKPKTKRIPVEDLTKFKSAEKKTIVLEKVVEHGKWFVKDGVKQRVKRTYTDITPLYIPR